MTSKSRSSSILCTRTEPTIPRQPMMPTFIADDFTASRPGLYRLAGASHAAFGGLSLFDGPRLVTAAFGGGGPCGPHDDTTTRRIFVSNCDGLRSVGTP